MRRDITLFTTRVYSDSFGRPQYDGERRIIAEIIRDSYGLDKRQHTFTLRIIASDGVEPLVEGTTNTRKGRDSIVTACAEWAGPMTPSANEGTEEMTDGAG